MVMPITLYPSDIRSAAATEESTPPLMPTATVIFLFSIFISLPRYKTIAVRSKNVSPRELLEQAMYRTMDYEEKVSTWGKNR
jgi:hypothetical protein